MSGRTLTGDAHGAFIFQSASMLSDLSWDASHVSTTRQFPVAVIRKYEIKFLFHPSAMISTGRFRGTVAAPSGVLKETALLLCHLTFC